MAHRKGRKVLNHGVINVTDIEDDLEEFDLSHDNNSHVSRGTSVAGSRDSSHKAQRTDMSSLTGALRHDYKDPLSNKGYVDPLQTGTLKDPFKQNDKVGSSSRSQDSDASKKQPEKTNNTRVQNGGYQQTVHNDLSSTQYGTRQQKTMLTTPSSASKPVSHAMKHATHMKKKNQKGFSHEERDLFIDDIEDF